MLIIDAGRPRNRFAPAAHGFLGQDGRAPAAILDSARAQLLAYPTATFCSDEATNARVDDGVVTLTLGSGATVRGRSLVLATGILDDLPDIPGLCERWGVTVLHCPYCHGYEVADRRLGVLATGPLSVHQALLLPDWSRDVTLFTNGAVDPDAAQQHALAERGGRVERRGVAALVGEAPVLSGVQLDDGTRVPVDALFTASRPGSRAPLRLSSAVPSTTDHSGPCFAWMTGRRRPCPACSPPVTPPGRRTTPPSLRRMACGPASRRISRLSSRQLRVRRSGAGRGEATGNRGAAVPIHYLARLPPNPTRSWPHSSST